MKVKLLSYTPNIEKIIAASSLATRRNPAHKIIDTITENEARKHIGRVMSYGHESISEFAFFIFSVEGVSRVLTHQLVRHRIASYLQMSSRHVNLSHLGFITPPTISKNVEANRIFNEVINNSKKNYIELLKMGIPKEDARYLLPDSIETHIVIGMNGRSLNHYFGLRLCQKAQWEIRELANKMRDLVKDKNSSIFWSEPRPCVIRGKCPQEKSCGFYKTNKFEEERIKYLKGYPHEKK